MAIRGIMSEGHGSLSSFSRREALYRLVTASCGAALPPHVGRMAFAEKPQNSNPHTSEPTGNSTVDTILGAFESMPLVTTKINDRLAVLSGPGGNMLVLTSSDGALIVDTGVHPTAAKVFAGAEAFAGKPITTVVNTHWHFDHVGGNELFASRGARLIAHENTRARMSHNQLVEAFNYVVPASPKKALPTITFPELMTLHFGSDVLHLEHVAPAHTDNDILVQIPDANLLHTGDILFNGVYPAIDYSTGGWIGGMVAAEDRALALCDAQTRVIAGHGPMGSVGDLRAAREMLATIQARIEKLLDSGKSTDQIVVAAPTRDFDDKWGKGLYKGEAFTRLATAGIIRHRQSLARGQGASVEIGVLERTRLS
jgi:cyclase